MAEEHAYSGFDIWQGTDPQTGEPVIILMGPEAGREVVYERGMKRVPHARDTWRTANGGDPWRMHTRQQLSNGELNNLTRGFHGEYAL